MIEAGLQEPKIYVGNLESLRTYADVRDAVKAYYMLVTKNPQAGEYYNIGGTYTCKIADMLNYLISQSTVDNIEIVTDPERLRPIDADLQVPDTTKFESHTGWKPEYTFEQTMNDLLQYWRDKVKSGRKFFKTMNILVIGDSCTDVFRYGKVTRIAPEAPVPIIVPEKETSNPGMAGNVVANLKALGANIKFLTNKTEIRKVRYVCSKYNHLLLRVDENELLVNVLNLQILYLLIPIHLMLLLFQIIAKDF